MCHRLGRSDERARQVDDQSTLRNITPSASREALDIERVRNRRLGDHPLAGHEAQSALRLQVARTARRIPGLPVAHRPLNLEMSNRNASFLCSRREPTCLCPVRAEATCIAYS